MIKQTQTKAHRTKEEFVYDTLRTAIMHCELEPGQKIVIDTLSGELGVSPIPVRGALQRLQAEGLVEITPHTGTTVSSISPETVNEIFILLDSLEQIAFTAATERVTPEDIDHLRNLVDQMALAYEAKDADRWYDLNNQFHLTVAELAKMPLLLRFTTRALDSRDRLRYFYFEQFITSRMAESHADHCLMIDLLSARDVDGLREVVSQHNLKAKAAYTQIVKQTETVRANGIL